MIFKSDFRRRFTIFPGGIYLGIYHHLLNKKTTPDHCVAGFFKIQHTLVAAAGRTGLANRILKLANRQEGKPILKGIDGRAPPGVEPVA